MIISTKLSPAHAPPCLPEDVLRFIADEVLDGIMSTLTAEHEARTTSSAQLRLVGDLAIGLWLARPDRTPPRLVRIHHEYGRQSHASRQGLKSLFSACKGVKHLEFGGMVNFDFEPSVFASPGLADLERMTLPSHLVLPPLSPKPVFPFRLKHLHLVNIKQCTLTYLPAVTSASKSTLLSFSYGGCYEASEVGLAQALSPIAPTLESFKSHEFGPMHPKLLNFVRSCRQLRHFTCQIPTSSLSNNLPPSLVAFTVWQNVEKVSLYTVRLAINHLPNLELLLFHGPRTVHPDKLRSKQDGQKLLALCRERGTRVYIKGARHCT